MDILENVSEILLNSLDLEIKEVSFIYSGSIGDNISTGDIVIDKKQETLSLRFTETLRVGKGSVFISFSGVLNDSMK